MPDFDAHLIGLAEKTHQEDSFWLIIENAFLGQ